jgi:hypothetical protein
MDFLNMKFSPLFCYFRFLISKYSLRISSYAPSTHVLHPGEGSAFSPMQNKQNIAACVNFYVCKQDSGRFSVINPIVKQSPSISNTINSPKHRSCNLQLPAAWKFSGSLVHVKGFLKYVQQSVSDV